MSPYAIVAWLHSQHTHGGARPSLEAFYAVAVEMGYCTSNPMPQVKQLLRQVAVNRSAPHMA